MGADKRITSHSAKKTRRHFLQMCGRFATATPPTVTLLLAAIEQHYAVAHSLCGGMWSLDQCTYDQSRYSDRGDHRANRRRHGTHNGQHTARTQPK
jgi:hypothetical protein